MALLWLERRVLERQGCSAIHSFAHQQRDLWDLYRLAPARPKAAHSTEKSFQSLQNCVSLPEDL